MDSINGNTTSIKEETVDHSYDLGHGISSELTNNSNSEMIRPLHLFSHHDARNLARSNDVLNNASKLSISAGNYLNQGDVDKIKIKTEQNSDVRFKNIEKESIFNKEQNIKIEKVSNANAAKQSTDDTQTNTKTIDSFQDLSVSGVDGQNENSTGSTSNVVLEFWEVDKSEMSCNIVKESSQLVGHRDEQEISPGTKQKENVTSASDILKNRRTNLKQNPPKSTSAQYMIKENTGNNERSQQYLGFKGSDKISSSPDKCTSETLKITNEKLSSEKALPSILKHRRKVNIIYKNISEPTQTMVPKGSFAPMKIKTITKEDQRIFPSGLGKVQNYRETTSLLIDKAKRGAVNQKVNQQTASDPFVPEGIVMFSESFDHATPRIVQQNDMGSKGSKPVTKLEQGTLQNCIGKVQNDQITNEALLVNANKSADNKAVSQQTSSDSSVPCHERTAMYSESSDHGTPWIVQQNDIISKGHKPITKVKQRPLQNGLGKSQNDQITNEALLVNANKSAVNKAVSQQTSSDSSVPCHERTAVYSESSDHGTPWIYQNKDFRPKYSNLMTKVEKPNLHTSSDSVVPSPERIEMYSESFEHNTPRIVHQNDVGSNKFKSNRILYVENRTLKKDIGDKNKRKDLQIARSEFVNLPPRIPHYKKKVIVNILPKPGSNILSENAPANANKTTLSFKNLPEAPATNLVSLMKNPFQANPSALSHSLLQNCIVLMDQNQSCSVIRDNSFTTMQPITYIPLESVPSATVLTALPLGSVYIPFPVPSSHSNTVPTYSENLQQTAVEQMLNTPSDGVVVNRSPVNQTIHPNSINNLEYVLNREGLQPNLSFSSLGNSVQQDYLSQTIPLVQTSNGKKTNTISLDANNTKHSLPNGSFSLKSENQQLINYQLDQTLSGRPENHSIRLQLEEGLDAQVKSKSKHVTSDLSLNDTVRESSTQSSSFKAGTNTPEGKSGYLSACEIMGTPQHTNHETLQKKKNNGIQEKLLRPKINWKNLRRQKYLGNTGRPYQPKDGISRVRVDETKGMLQQTNYEKQEKPKNNLIQEPRPKINWKNLRRPKRLGDTRMRKTSFLNRIPGKKRKYTITNPLVLERLRRCCADKYKTPMPSDIIHDGTEVESPDLNIVVESVYSLSHETDRAKEILLHCNWFLKRQRSYFMNKFKRKMKLFGISNRKEFTDSKLSAPCLVVLDCLPNCPKRTLRKCGQTRKIYTKKTEACTQQCRDKVVSDFCYKISKGKIIKHYKQKMERDEKNEDLNQIYDCDNKESTNLNISTLEIMTLLKTALVVNMVHNSTGQTRTPLPTDIKALIQMFPRIVDANDNEFWQVKIANNSILINSTELESDNLSAIVNEKLRQDRKIDLQLRNESNSTPPDLIFDLSDDSSVILSESSDDKDEPLMKLNKGEECDRRNNNDDSDPTTLIAKYTYHRRSTSPWSDVSDVDDRNLTVETAANIDSLCVSAISNTKEQTVPRAAHEEERRNGVQFVTLTDKRKKEPLNDKETCKKDSNCTLPYCAGEDLSEEISNVNTSTTESIMQHLQLKDLLSDSMQHYPTIEKVVPKLQEFKSSLNGMLNNISYKRKKKTVREPSYQNQIDSSDIDIEIVNDETDTRTGKRLSTRDIGTHNDLTDRLITDIFQESHTVDSKCSTESNLETISLEDINESEKDDE
ncbi:uncharacterized protein LOC134687204 [Mytilus trossulus]|uniref:uncharacterized protein LOC134687204 n=1 Tax=Mytilus trossulus TaxID=6551 RepID=UPI00300796B2